MSAQKKMCVRESISPSPHSQCKTVWSTQSQSLGHLGNSWQTNDPQLDYNNNPRPKTAPLKRSKLTSN